MAKNDEALAALGTIVAELTDSQDASDTGRLWGAAHKALLKTDADKKYTAQIIMHRDLEALIALVGELTGGGTGEAPSTPQPTTPAQEIEPASLKAAMKIFRKRLKLTRLDDESRINVNPLTSGRGSSIVAIQAPYEFPKPVWQELVRQGKLKDAGRGFYELVE
ncbi:MAG: hypothetical protein KAS72_06960 [Phycisphaerales bacterium]|nr:hypothetical protein [Phycisphaerales bacterium]